MYSIAFPNFLDNTRVKLFKDDEATMSNIRLLLASWKTSLFGDPYFGTNLKRFLYDQNNIILRDILIDDIFVSLTEFVPQIVVTRNDISVTQKGTQLFAKIQYVNAINNETNLYEIKLTSEEFA